MYSISRQYGVTVQQLQEWNNLTGTELSIGQELLVAAPTGEAVKQNTPAAQNTTPAQTSPSVPASTVPVVVAAEQKKETSVQTSPRQNKKQKNKPFVFPNQ